MKITNIFPLLTILLFFACNSSKKALTQTSSKAEEEIQEVVIEERLLDTMVVTADKPNSLKEPEDYQLPKYNSSFPLINNIVHTKLDLRFDWAKQHVMGKATLTLKPWFYPVESVTLDAKGFDIHKVSFADSNTPLEFDYVDDKLTVLLGKKIQTNQEYKLFIDYTAKPAETGGKGGSDAITSDQGLYFINHDGKTPDKPMQIWTQGETESNSRWFPTVDKPNERCTQEMYITIEDRFKTLSNGLLLSSTKNSDGTRTDYWKMDQPHAPYLFMMAIGEFSVTKEKWQNIPLEYYVEPKYEPAAKNIFGHTPEMLDFFSEITGVKYPWQKYSQVIVRDYVSGAMENTTGVIFGDFVQKTNRELIDNHNDGIVAHEMFHHWFGDYVTCESWANLTMNEGFANYGEYLWFEHQYGKDEADSHRRNEMGSYFQSTAQGGAHDLIHFGYDDKEDMFDAHSYNKGGLVLHMLRNFVGDEIFNAGMKKYLNDNAYTAVEAHDLRLAFEEVSGQDLNWFFNQWYFEAGHPMLDISHKYTAGKATVTIQQLQNPDQFPAIFILPFAIDVYNKNGKAIRHEVVLNQRIQTFTFDVAEEPALVNVDADNILLAEVKEALTAEQYVFQYNHTTKYQDRFDALEALKEVQSGEAQQVYVKAINDPFWGLRRTAIRNLTTTDQSVINNIAALAEKDPRAQVRAAALDFVSETGNQKYISLMKKTIEKEQSYGVIASGLRGMANLDPKSALGIAKKMEKEDNGSIINAVGQVYGKIPSAENLSFFENKWDDMPVFASFDFFENYFNVMKGVDDTNVKKAIAKLNTYAKDQEKSPWKRFASIKAMHDMREAYVDRASATSDAAAKETIKANVDEISSMINTLKANETHEQLKMIINTRF